MDGSNKLSNAIMIVLAGILFLPVKAWRWIKRGRHAKKD